MKNGRYNTLCLDFDDTIRSTATNEPIEGALTSVRRLHNQGWRVVVLTANSLAFVSDWLAKRGFDKYVSDVTATKPTADAYLDDKGIRFLDWAQAMSAIRHI